MAGSSAGCPRTHAKSAIKDPRFPHHSQGWLEGHTMMELEEMREHLLAYIGARLFAKDTVPPPAGQDISDIAPCQPTEAPDGAHGERIIDACQHHVHCRCCARAASVPTVRPDEPAMPRATRTMVPTVQPDEPALPGAARTIGEHCATNHDALHTALAASRAEHIERESKTEAELRAEVTRAMAASVLPQGTRANRADRGSVHIADTHTQPHAQPFTAAPLTAASPLADLEVAYKQLFPCSDVGQHICYSRLNGSVAFVSKSGVVTLEQVEPCNCDGCHLLECEHAMCCRSLLGYDECPLANKFIASKAQTLFHFLESCDRAPAERPHGPPGAQHGKGTGGQPKPKASVRPQDLECRFHHPAEERSKGDFACSAENRMLLKHFVARSKDATDTTVHMAPEGAGIAGCNHNLQLCSRTRAQSFCPTLCLATAQT